MRLSWCACVCVCGGGGAHVVAQDLQLTHIADSFVGHPDDGGGISGGERKRVAVGAAHCGCWARVVECVGGGSRVWASRGWFAGAGRAVLRGGAACRRAPLQLVPHAEPACLLRTPTPTFVAIRLLAGVELVAGSRVLILDEPTSGLDSRSADLVMRVLRDVAYSGCVVICSIHQPTSRVFRSFDKVRAAPAAPAVLVGRPGLV
jgi:hypothetical protein